MSDIQAKDDLLWGFIARCIYAGFICYALLFLLALLRDFVRNRLGSHSSNHRPSRIRKLYFSFSGQYRDTYFFYYVELVRLTANLLVCAFYVLGTYRQFVNDYVSVIYRIFASFVCVDLVFAIFYADSAISTAFNFLRVIDAFSIPSLILAKGSDAYLNFAFLRAVSAYAAFGRLERRMFVHIFSARRLIVKLSFQCATLFYTLAAGIQLLEVPGDLLPVGFRTEWSKYGDWNFLNATYFIIVTLSTVGYGDFSPSTMQGRIYTLFIIIVGIFVFTSVISELGKQASEARGSGHFIKNSRTRHVVVTGTPTLTDLVHFVSEFYSDSRQSNVAAKVVVLVEQPNWSDTDWFQYIARNQFLQNRLQFLMGSPLNASDLQRAKAHCADAVFILTSPSTGKDPTLQDTTTIMIVLAVRNYRSDVPIFAQTILEDSNLQTFVALRTPSSSAGSSRQMRNDVDNRATYPGLFHSVIHSESELMAMGTQRQSRLYLQGLYRGHRSRYESETLLNPPEPEIHALKRSQHVCLQETHMALISGNIKANGVGTLISNMYLDVQPMKITNEEPAWLSEYHMGATCSLVHVIIPDELDGAYVKEIANDLYHLGLLLIATSDPKDNIHPRPVLSVGTTLNAGHLGMVLTYHQPRYVSAGFLLTALRYSNGNLRHAESKSPVSGEFSSLGDKTFRDEVTGSVTPWSKTRNKSPQEIKAEIEKEEKEAEKSRSTQQSNGSYSLKISHSSDDLEALAESENLHLVKPNEEVPNDVPDGLKGHIIVAMEGSSTLQNLILLLKNLWRRNNRKSSQVSKRPRIVVIHPSFSDEFRRLFAPFKRYVFFVEGSPASRSMWRKAQLNTASSVATVADYTQPWHVSDARTIFTLLTLDCCTASDQDLFICSELIEEKSLEFLREPIHARRVGASLGESSERLPSTAGEIVWPSNSSHTAPTLGEPSASTEEQHSSEGIETRKDKGRTLKFLDTAVDIERRLNEQLQATAGSSLHGSIDDPITTATSVDMNGNSSIRSSKGKSRRPVTRLQSIKTPSALKASENRSTAVLPIDDPDAIANETGEEGATPGADRARRGTLFSRSRYASGELLVQSSAITLLTREYIEPGFVRFFTNILGTDTNSLGMKIRLVRIPKAMFDPERGYTCKTGRPLIRFNDVFRILVRLGVTPLGMYRSGSAPVLIPWKARRKRGPAIRKELDPLLETLAKNSDETKQAVDASGVGRFFQQVANELGSLAPGNLREQQGRDEVVRGRFRQFFSNDDDDDSSDEFDFDDENDGGQTPRRPDFLRRRSAMEDNTEPEGTEEKGSRGKRVVSPRRKSDQIPRVPSRFTSWRGPRLHETPSKFVNNDDQTLEVPGKVKYMERPRADNLLPYVYTLPDPNTWCAETDGIFILCAPSFELPSKWLETSEEDIEMGVDSISSFPP